MKRTEGETARRLRRLKRRATFALVLSVIIVAPSPSYVDIGMLHAAETGELPSLVADFSTVPQSVVEDATSLAQELFKESSEKGNEFVSQLLQTYLEARDKDFIMLFNAGGWGWKPLEPSAEWYSISNGIKSELDKSGYKLLFFDYQRTSRTLRGYLEEFIQQMTRYPSKSKDLASRVTFLTSHIPNLKVILAGESNGSVIVDSTLNIVGDNPQVYSIQTGPPFWLESGWQDRALILTNNGLVPDSFTEGDIFTMIATSLEDVLGFSRPANNSGHIMFYVGAPGHDYQWRYPAVYSQIADFIYKNFGIKW